MRAGSLLEVGTELVELGAKTLRYLHRMRNSETAEEVASMDLLVGYLDTATRPHGAAAGRDRHPRTRRLAAGARAGAVNGSLPSHLAALGWLPTPGGKSRVQLALPTDLFMVPTSRT